VADLEANCLLDDFSQWHHRPGVFREVVGRDMGYSANRNSTR
jgi:hypothetical protein